MIATSQHDLNLSENSMHDSELKSTRMMREMMRSLQESADKHQIHRYASLWASVQFAKEGSAVSQMGILIDSEFCRLRHLSDSDPFLGGENQVEFNYCH